jgi:cell division protein FtsN
MSLYCNKKSLLFALFLLVGGCVSIDDVGSKRLQDTGLIATPPTYYSTAKARYLGAKYKGNLDRLVERITRNPKTASLQFANNISSVGGIGFFTHSATKTADERYLEVVLATPETFEVKGEFSEKVQNLFSRYGIELLDIVSADNEIYQDREMSGYGLNLAWRNNVSQPTGSRVAVERAIIYISKERVREVLRQGVNPNELLTQAVIFAVEEDGPLTLVSYRPKESRSDVRAAIKEDNLNSASILPAAPEILARESNSMSYPEMAEPEVIAQEQKPEDPPIAQAPVETKRTNLRTPVELPAAVKEIERANVTKLPEVSMLPASASEAATTVVPPQEADSISVGPLAALKRPSEDSGQKVVPAVRPALKLLEGYIIQVAFNDREKAQRWAESMAKRGFAVSLTEAGGEGSLRVRVGNFTVRDEAERQLRLLKQDGLSGIVVSLPQAYRPVARTSMP